METGLIVYSKAGSDKGRFFTVMSFSDKAVEICDGKRYKISNPKHKNLKHIGVTNTVLSIYDLKTDKAMRTALAVYRSKL